MQINILYCFTFDLQQIQNHTSKTLSVKRTTQQKKTQTYNTYYMRFPQFKNQFGRRVCVPIAGSAIRA